MPRIRYAGPVRPFIDRSVVYNGILDHLQVTADVYPFVVRDRLAEAACWQATGSTETKRIETGIAWLRARGHVARSRPGRQRFRQLSVTVTDEDMIDAAACPEYDPDGP